MTSLFSCRTTGTGTAPARMSTGEPPPTPADPTASPVPSVGLRGCAHHGLPACHLRGAAHPPQHTIMVELGPFAPYHYKHSHKHLTLAECFKTSNDLEGTWSMRQVLMFRFGVCSLLVEPVVPITTKTQFAKGQGEGFYLYGCDICRKYPFACFLVVFFMYWFQKGAKQHSSQNWTSVAKVMMFFSLAPQCPIKY